MHELAIADAIARIAEEHAASRPVKAIRVRVGHLRQVVPSALRFAFELATRDTALGAARLDLEPMAAVGRCQRCAIESPQPAFPLMCAGCGSLDVAVVHGDELYVESLELEDDAPAPPPETAEPQHGRATT